MTFIYKNVIWHRADEAKRRIGTALFKMMLAVDYPFPVRETVGVLDLL